MTRKSNVAVVVLSALACLASLGFSSEAEAQRRGRGRFIEGVRFDVHLDFGWHQAFGVGFRVDIPIVPDGLIDGTDDELAISPGAELFFYDFEGHHHDRDDHHHGWNDHDGVSLMPLVALQWNFYINQDWSLFPELGIALAWWSYDHCHGGCHSHGETRLFPFLGLGARYHFNDRNALLFRINWPAGLQIGITF